MTHQTISFIKSFVRIVGYVLMIPLSFGLLTPAALVLVASEVIGILEEFGEN